MSDSPAQPAGQTTGMPRAGPQNIPQAVMEFLQQHGYDKILQALQAEMQTRGTEAKEADAAPAAEGAAAGEAAPAAATTTAAAPGAEAIIRAPEPIALDNMVKRNIPQATTVSVSTMSDRITPEFIAQAKYVIDQLQTRLEAANADEEAGRPPQNPGAFIDPSDRVEGYKRYRNWVSEGLDLWRVSSACRCQS